MKNIYVCCHCSFFETSDCPHQHEISTASTACPVFVQDFDESDYKGE